MEHYLDKSNQTPTIVVKNIEYNYLGAIEEATFLDERFFINQQGHYQLFESGNAFQKDTLHKWWEVALYIMDCICCL